MSGIARQSGPNVSAAPVGAVPLEKAPAQAVTWRWTKVTSWYQVIKYICTQAACYLIIYLVFQIPGGSIARLIIILFSTFPLSLVPFCFGSVETVRKWSPLSLRPIDFSRINSGFSNRCLTACKGSRGSQLWNLTSWYELLLGGELPTNRK